MRVDIGYFILYLQYISKNVYCFNNGVLIPVQSTYPSKKVVVIHLININIRQPDCPSLRIEGFPYAEGSTIAEYSSDAIDRGRIQFEDVVSEIPDSDMVVINMSGDLSLFRHSQDILDATASHGIPVILVFNNRERSVPYRGLFTGTDDE